MFREKLKLFWIDGFLGYSRSHYHCQHHCHIILLIIVIHRAQVIKKALFASIAPLIFLNIIYLSFFFNLLCSLIHEKSNSCVKMVMPVHLKKQCHSFSQVYKNTPSAKDISYKLGYSSVLIKVFWNGWYDFIVAYDIIEIIDWKGRTEYLKHKAGKEFRNLSKIPDLEILRF